MTDIQAQLAIQITPDEYELLQRFRTANAEQRRQALIALSAQGTFGSVEKLISDAAALRTEISAEALRAATDWRNLGAELMPHDEHEWGFDDE